jgi:rhodanese-related sulfurtransferase
MSKTHHTYHRFERSAGLVRPGIWGRRTAVGWLVTAFPFLLTACAGTGTSSEKGAAFLLSVDVPREAAEGAVLVDVRGPTERRNDGIPKRQHHWIPFGADRWRGGASLEEEENFLRRASDKLGPVTEAPRLIIICSVGVRSEAAARVLAAAGYDANNLQDGWIGNDMGAGLRALEQGY